MDYKKIIKSRSVRLKVLNLLRWIPDKTMLKIQYRIKFKRKLDLKKPKRFTEKIQWYKLYYRDEKMIKCVDKYDVRDFVSSIGLKDILTKCYGVFSSYSEIDFDDLPDRFVIKDTLGGGGNSVFICNNKADIVKKEFELKTEKWLDRPMYKNGGREWPYYSGKKNRLIIEELIEGDNKHGLVDYKFLCFNGKVNIIYVMCDRNYGVDVKLGIFSRSLKKMNVTESTEKELDFEYIFPDNIGEMIRIAEKIGKNFPQVRVDLYNSNNKIIFGELTFYDESGYMIFKPDSFDSVLGDKFKLPNKINNMK